MKPSSFQKTEQLIALCARLADEILGDENTLSLRGTYKVGATDTDIEKRLGEAISKLEKKYKQANDQVIFPLLRFCAQKFSFAQIANLTTLFDLMLLNR